MTSFHRVRHWTHAVMPTMQARCFGRSSRLHWKPHRKPDRLNGHCGQAGIKAGQGLSKELGEGITSIAWRPADHDASRSAAYIGARAQACPTPRFRSAATASRGTSPSCGDAGLAARRLFKGV